MGTAMGSLINEDVRTDLKAFLLQRFPLLAAEPIVDETRLLTTGAIDSLGILELVTFLAERFGIELQDEDLDRANFESFGQLARFVERLRS